MKKVYSKPEVMFEDFTMSTNIATGCERTVGNHSKGSCAVVGTGNVAVFTNTMINICDYTPTEVGGNKDDEWDGFCYHVPTEYNNLFNS